MLETDFLKTFAGAEDQRPKSHTIKMIVSINAGKTRENGDFLSYFDWQCHRVIRPSYTAPTLPPISGFFIPEPR